MAELPTYAELAGRINAHLASAQGDAQHRDIALVWDGYLAGLLEWQLISVGDHQRLHGLLPAIADNPTAQIFLGVDA